MMMFCLAMAVERQFFSTLFGFLMFRAFLLPLISSDQLLRSRRLEETTREYGTCQSTQRPLPTVPNLSPSWEDQSRSSTARSHWLDVSQAAMVLLKLMMVHSTLWSNIDDLSKIKKLGSWFLPKCRNAWGACEEHTCIIMFDNFWWLWACIYCMPLTRTESRPLQN